MVSDPIIVSGQLTKISESKKAPGNTWRYEYIKVDDRRFNNVFVANYINDDFQDGVGGEITLSIAPMPKKNTTGMVVALRIGSKVERSPELSTGKAVGVTLIDIGVNILPYAIITFFIWLGLFIGLGLLLSNFVDDDPKSLFGDLAFTAMLLTIVIMVYQLFLSKKSTLGARATYNAAVRALD